MTMMRPSSFSVLQSLSFLSPSSPSSSRPLPLFDHHSSDPDSCFTPDFRSQSSMLNGRRSRPTTTTALKAVVLYSSRKDETTDDDNYEEEMEDVFESIDDVESEAAMSGSNEPKMIKLRTRKRTGAQYKLWQQRFVEMKQYQNANNGSSYPPTGTSLGNWAALQRKQYNQGQLCSDRQKFLNGINFQWKPRNRAMKKRLDWDKMYSRLVKYKEKYGNTSVSQYYQDDRQLGRWCYGHKRAYRKGNLDPEKKARLDEIGFMFDEVASKDQRWKEIYNRLFKYWKENGHSNFQQKNKKDPQLGMWVLAQRTAYKQGKLSLDRIEMLESIGFVWDHHEDVWFEMYNRLVDYWKENGHSNFQQKNKKDPQLRMWVPAQRMAYKQGKLSLDRIEMLESIGFVWDHHEDVWFEMYNRLVDYWKENGHSNFPSRSKKDPKLGKW
eukprot:CAMPEP_0113466572 /NCGR_PEP_ID=MMETSP0014_2-20120614/14344_1 /TAXON_ID=2857 /ORGANISM="Nitzschia sp." /LENGTH=436 /DNA_ID=CAMNT_0000358805 /DNA_START=437 /DNA_END=1744 /DNA_ORIENTATION=+ /assembly_acc=CAM_ASM_000159